MGNIAGHAASDGTTIASWMAQMIEVGQTVGNYRITAKLGEGGMGMVFQAEHPVIGRRAALKAIHPQFSVNPEVISRFVNEARVISQIGHQHIVDVTDFGRTPDGDFYFIMEYLPGEALSESLQRDAPFAPARALAIAAQIADALEASHAQGIIHRDLKPENVFLIPRGGSRDFVKVLDFGLAKLTHSDASAVWQTSAGLIMGTPFYMAPEQCEGREVDQRADIYSLGVILFELVTGKVPFGGDSSGEVIMKKVTMRAPAARSLVADLPEAIEIILHRALAKDPGERFQSMTELRAALLDPVGQAGAAPQVLLEDLSERVRTARPMARTESGRPPRTHTTLRASAGSFGAAPAGPSRERHQRRAWLGIVGVTLAGVALAVGIPRLHHAGPKLSSVPARSPAVIRVTFGSDPTGAEVFAEGGRVVGTTPLWIELPANERPARYVFRKAGFLPKTMAIIPDISLPLFAILEPARAPQAPANAAAPSDAPRRSHHARLFGARRPRRKLSNEDDILTPSFR